MDPLTYAEGANVRSHVSDDEWKLRVDLAACYRLVAHYGWDDLVFTHISARVPGPEHHFLINPYGALFEEITASSLVKVHLNGRPVMDTPFPVNPAGFTIHSAIHAANEDARCVLHTHSLHGVAIAARQGGLELVSQQALSIYGTLGYHDYEGIAVRDDEKARLVADLGKNKLLILRNHGLLAVGRTIPDAFLAMYTLESACRIQVLAESGGKPLSLVPKALLETIEAESKIATMGSFGDLAWPALLRRLDRKDPSFRR
ncbi:MULTISPECIES: class II aldolase/adducin family protein [Paraburkholderia]|uniref:class II aldolase/adducin family protein n=1 Tax=Paraburkholderia TaxID=1822464 RepID=UPI002AB062B9|nr:MULTISPECIES: class II aldolase/adducin family protein [Paraburkholderia]